MKQEHLLDILKTISSIHRSQFDQRRAYEWRVIFSTLGVFAISVAAKLTGRAILPETPLFTALVWLSFIILASITSIYLYYIHKANEVNKRFAQAAEHALMDLSRVKAFAQIEIPTSVRWAWSLTWQVVTLLLFAIAASAIITVK